MDDNDELTLLLRLEAQEKRDTAFVTMFFWIIMLLIAFAICVV